MYSTIARGAQIYMCPEDNASSTVSQPFVRKTLSDNLATRRSVLAAVTASSHNVYDSDASVIKESNASQYSQPTHSLNSVATKTFETMIQSANYDLNSVVITAQGRLDKLVALSKTHPDPAHVATLEHILDHGRACVAAALDARNAVDYACTALVALHSNANLLGHEVNNFLLAAETLFIVPNVEKKKEKELPPLPISVEGVAIAAPITGDDEEDDDERTLRVLSPAPTITTIPNDELRRSARFGCGPTLRLAHDAREMIIGDGEEALGKRLKVRRSISDMKEGAGRLRKRVSGLFPRGGK